MVVEDNLERKRSKIIEYTFLLNRYGVDSSEAAQFVEAHKDDAKFVNLAKAARWLKKALQSRR
jgi:hypothetical protein